MNEKEQSKESTEEFCEATQGLIDGPLLLREEQLSTIYCKSCDGGFMTFYKFKTWDGLTEETSFCSNALCLVNERRIIPNIVAT